MWHYHYVPSINALAVPVFVVIAILTALAGGLWLSMLYVRFRDVQVVVPFLIQAWMFLTPVAYSSSSIPLRWRPLMGVNPMTSVVEGFRWAFVGGQAPWASHAFGVSLAVDVLVFVTGVVFFRRTEKTFADLI
jgi:lipopolysaccharide transport system permease protein